MSKDFYCPCVLNEGNEIVYNPSFFNRVFHIGKKYYHGRIRWLLTDKSGNGISCDMCGNIANGLVRGKVLKLTYSIPLCKKHLEAHLKPE